MWWSAPWGVREDDLGHSAAGTLGTLCSEPPPLLYGDGSNHVLSHGHAGGVGHGSWGGLGRRAGGVAAYGRQGLAAPRWLSWCHLVVSLAQELSGPRADTGARPGGCGGRGSSGARLRTGRVSGAPVRTSTCSPACRSSRLALAAPRIA